MMRPFAFLLATALMSNCLDAQIVSNPVLTTFKPYASSGYVTPPATTVPRMGMTGPVTTYRYLPGAAVGQTSRPVMSYRVPITRYYAAPQRVAPYAAGLTQPQVVYRVPVSGQPVPIITYYSPVRSAGMAAPRMSSYYRPAYQPPTPSYTAPRVQSTNAGCGCGR